MSIAFSFELRGLYLQTTMTFPPDGIPALDAEEADPIEALLADLGRDPPSPSPYTC